MDYVTRQFINLTKKFRKESRKVLAELLRAIQQQTEAIRKTNKRQDTQHEPEQPPITVRAELYVPENVEKDRRTHEDRQHGLQIWVVIGTWAAFLAASAYAYVAVRQWREMIAVRHQAQGAIEAANRSATAAENILASSQKFSKVELRAYLTPTHVEHPSMLTEDYEKVDPTKPPPSKLRVCADVTWENVGRTPGIGGTLGYATTAPNAEQIVNAFFDSLKKKKPTSPYGIGSVIGSNDHGWKTICTKEPMESAAAAKVYMADYPDDRPMVVYGVIEYFDIFKDYHETGFCSFRIPHNANFAACGYGNWLDEYQNQKKPEGRPVTP